MRGPLPARVPEVTAPPHDRMRPQDFLILTVLTTACAGAAHYPARPCASLSWGNGTERRREPVALAVHRAGSPAGRSSTPAIPSAPLTTPSPAPSSRVIWNTGRSTSSYSAHPSRTSSGSGANASLAHGGGPGWRRAPPVVDVGVGVENSGVGGPARGSGVRDTEVMDDAGNGRLAGALTVW